MIKQRNQTIDLAKGIAIILMVAGHCYHTENDVLRLIYAFHMPFFFLVSGMLYADKWHDGITFSVFRTGRKLLIPYFVFDTLFCLFVTVLSRPDDLVGTFLKACIRQIVPLLGTTVTWYLPCQLMVLCLFALGAKHLKKNVLITVCVFSYMIVILAPSYVLLPLLRSMIGVGFFAVGFYEKAFFTRKQGLPLLCGIGPLYYVLVRLNGMVSLVSLKFSNPVLYTVNSLLGSWFLYQACLRMPNGKGHWIKYLGQNSVIVLCTHMFFVEVIRLLDYKLFDNALYTFGILEGFIFGGIVIGCMFPVIDISNRFLGKLFGK